MAGERIVLRPAETDDIDDLTRLETASWPEGLAANNGQISARIAAYPNGQWVAESDGRLLGYSSAQRIRPALLDVAPLNYTTLTDCDRFTATHANDGEFYQLVGVSTHPDFRGQRIGRQLVDHQVGRAWTLGGIRRVLGFTRPAGRHLAPPGTLEDYLATQFSSDARDKTLAFHLDSGAVIVSFHEDFRACDQECLGAGVLIEYFRPQGHPAEC